MQRHFSRKSSRKAEASAVLRPSSLKRKRSLVLCIDDEASGLAIRKLVLEESGYEVVACLNGEEGLAMFSALPVRIVVLDYAMPGLNGVRIAERMREIKPDVPIIMLSGYPDPPEGSAGLVDVYIVKSEGPHFLLSIIQQMLKRTKPIAAA